MATPPGQPHGHSAEQPAAGPQLRHRFGASAPFSIGVEEELLLVDGRRRLAAAAERVMRSLSPEVREWVSTEIFAGQIELKTGVCHDAGQALEELSRLRRTVGGADVQLMGSGLHPADEGEAQLVAKRRYDVVKEDLASLLSTPPCGPSYIEYCAPRRSLIIGPLPAS